MKKKEDSVNVELQQIQRGHIQVFVKGLSPLVCNRMSEKVRQGLLLPPIPKNKTERQSTLKHDPMGEYRSSPYTLKATTSPTLIALPGASFKRAMASAAIDMGGVKTQIGRLAWVVEELIPVYGIPQLWMTITRQRDMARTPDVRTRAILPAWTATFTVQFVKPILKENALALLIAGAGEFIGVGDGRPEKGALAFGRYQICDQTDPEIQHLMKHGGRAAQEAALQEPGFYDLETEELYAWFLEESKRRELRPASDMVGNGNGEDHGEDLEATDDL